MLNTYFRSNQSITLEQIITYTEDPNTFLPFLLREHVTKEGRWEVEAYQWFEKDNIEFQIVFDHDVLSPSKTYNQQELTLLFEKLTNKITLIKGKLKL